MKRLVVGVVLLGTLLVLANVAQIVQFPPFLSHEYRAEAQNVPELRWGSTGQNVKNVQWRLHQWGYYRGAIDGVYGATTYGAIVNFQRRNGITPADGVVRASTWQALGLWSTVAGGGGGGGGGGAAAAPANRPTGQQGQPVASINRADQLDLLARVIAAEAQGEPFEGQVAVGAVILNRIRSPEFPNTLSGVVHQPHAFESITNGLVWRRTPSQEAVRAARSALDGWDPTYGSIFFWNPNKPVVAWIWTRPIVVRIGNHVFAR